jgi:hypothetical protein
VARRQRGELETSVVEERVGADQKPSGLLRTITAKAASISWLSVAGTMSICTPVAAAAGAAKIGYEGQLIRSLRRRERGLPTAL